MNYLSQLYCWLFLLKLIKAVSASLDLLQLSEYIMKKLSTMLFGCLLAVSPLTQVQAQPQKPYIAVSGNAQLQVKPDIVRIEFQSIAVENEAGNAKQVVDDQVQLLLSTLAENGFEEALLTRGDLQLRPEYEMIEKKRTEVGIKATRNLSYQLDDLSTINAFLQLLVEADISNIGQINYALKNPLQWQEKARDLAVKDAINKAKGLAESYQVELGKVYSINYQGSNIRPIMMRAMESDEMTAASYQHHEITINERVESVFLLAY